MLLTVLDFTDIKDRHEDYNPESDFEGGVVRLAVTWAKTLRVKRNDIVLVRHGKHSAFYAVKFHPVQLTQGRTLGGRGPAKRPL